MGNANVNVNGRTGDVEFARAVYSFLINGEHIATRKLRILVQEKLGREVATQKIAQFVYNKKASGILTLDENKNNYLTEQGMIEAKKIVGYEPLLDDVGDINDSDINDISVDDYVEREQHILDEPYNNNSSRKSESILRQLAGIRDCIGRELLVDGSDLDEIIKLVKIYKTLDELIKQEN